MNTDLITFLTTINSLTIMSVINYVICFFAENITENSLKIADIVYDFDWYEYPIKKQRLFVVWIQCGQKAFFINGMGIINGSRATFLMVKIYYFNKFSLTST